MSSCSALRLEPLCRLFAHRSWQAFKDDTKDAEFAAQKQEVE
jgi:hypothetical protein